MRMRGKFLIAALVCLMAAGTLMAQSSKGSIIGTVVDEGNQPLPGVTVLLSSPNMQGTRSDVTDADGRFRFNLLVPGTYKAVFSLPGYQRVEQENIVVGVSQTITVNPTLHSTFKEEVLVTTEAPVVDVTSTTVGANLSQQTIKDLPMGRTFSSLTFLAAGAVSGGLGNNASIGGASAAENRYVIDDLDTTDPAFGTIGAGLAINFVQEMQVQTGGYEPEYGGALGGFINMVTKSGSNEFHGEIFGYYTDDSFAVQAKIPETRGAATPKYTDYDVGFDVGGRIIRDKLWFFVGYNPNVRKTTVVNNVNDRAGNLVQTNTFEPKTTTNYYTGKLTWQINENNSLTGTIIGDPAKIDDDYNTSYYIDSQYLPSDMVYKDHNLGGMNYGLAYNGILNENMILELKAGHHDNSNDFSPRSDLPWYEDGTTSGAWSNGIGNRVRFGGPSFQQFNGDRYRDQARAAFTWFIGDSHELKAGVQWNWVHFDDFAGVVGSSKAFCAPILPWAYTFVWQIGDYVDLTPDNEDVLKQVGITFCDPGNGDAYGGVQIPDRVGNRLRMRNWGWYNSNYKQASTGQTDESAIYIQDSWKVTDYFTLKFGVRADATKVTGSGTGVGPALVGGQRSIRLTYSDTIQPRLGLTWDFAHNGRSKFFAHYGKFYESIPLDINVRAFGNENYDFYFYFYPDSGLPTINNEAAGFGNNTGPLFYILKAGGGTAADKNLGGQYTEEYVAGAEYEVANNLSLGIQGIYRRLGRVIEDISVDGGNSYFITNPGGWYYENPVTGIPLDTPAFFPRPSRIYRAIELKMNKRFSNNWQMYASLLWSRNKGNYGGLFRQDNGQLDPNITSLYDLPDLLNGAYGLLPNDHKWQFKMYGSYRFNFGLITGLNMSWYTGTPISMMGAHSTYGPNERFVTPRGSAGRTPTINRWDLHLEYPMHFGNMDLAFIVDVFNLFNTQKALTVDQEWTIMDQNEAAGLTPEEQKTNDDWGKPTSFQSPRNFRVGLKLSW